MITFMQRYKSILDKYNEYLRINRSYHVRAYIKEDEDSGHAIVEYMGKPINIDYNPITGSWE